MIFTARTSALGLWLLLVAGGAAQSVSVYSELTRIDPLGQPVQADRGVETPREILSPAIARNAIASFQMVVEGLPEKPFTFQVVQNPDNAVRLTVYRERYTRVGAEWVPDALEPVPVPFDGRFGDSNIAGQTAQTFWVDVFAERTAPVRRIRIEAQAFVGDGWIVYPLEIRIRSAMLGSTPLENPRVVEDITKPLTASAISAWKESICGPPATKTHREPSLTIRDFVARNAAQDVRFAGGVPPASLLSLAGATDRAAFCRRGGPAKGGEEYLRIRDALIGAVE